MIYLVYTHMSSEGQNWKSVLDGDTDQEVLRNRVNEYMASPKMINYHRGIKQEIPPGKNHSQTYNGSGGGCFYSTWMTIEELKSPTVT